MILTLTYKDGSTKQDKVKNIDFDFLHGILYYTLENPPKFKSDKVYIKLNDQITSFCVE